jgi:cytochrome c556
MHRPLIAAALATSLCAPVAAQSNDAAEAAVKARQSLMTLIAYNLGPMAQMAQGRVDYDAETAQAAADNLYTLTRHSQERFWPEGTAHGTFDGTAARPEIWQNLEEFSNRYTALQDAAATMQDAAGDGLQSLQGALGDVGGACRSCHDDFRVSD